MVEVEEHAEFDSSDEEEDECYTKVQKSFSLRQEELFKAHQSQILLQRMARQQGSHLVC